MMSEPQYGTWSAAQLDEPIRYAQSWEDPATVNETLRIDAQSKVLAITSGGDNCLAMLIAGAESVTAVDMSAAQIALLELKVRAIEQLPHGECMHFIGVRSGGNRLAIYEELRPSLSEFARRYWDGQPERIAEGIIHGGKFERYFSLFRRRMLPLMQSRVTRRRFVNADSLIEQRWLYFDRWDNRRWRAFFRLFFSRFLLGRLGRDHAFFTQVRRRDIAEELLRRTERGLTDLPVADNFFVQYILTGHFADLRRAHPWMHPDTYEQLRERLSRLHLSVERMEECAGRTNRHFNAFYCSDIFEYMPQQAAETAMRALSSRAEASARFMYYTLFVPRPLPAWLSEDPDAAALFSRDRTFFYGGIQVGAVSEAEHLP